MKGSRGIPFVTDGKHLASTTAWAIGLDHGDSDFSLRGKSFDAWVC
jgi:hypothetical protein